MGDISLPLRRRGVSLSTEPLPGLCRAHTHKLQHLSEEAYKPNPVLVRALNILFILHADHELNCSTAAMRHIGSSQVDPFSAVAGAASALYGPLHGGACEVND